MKVADAGELFGLAIPLEPLALGFLQRRGSIGSDTLSEGVVLFSTTESFLILFPNKKCSQPMI